MANDLKNLPNSPDNVAAQERRVRVLNFRIQHHSLRSIAKKLNVSHQTVKNDLDKAMGELHKTETQRANDYRMMELQRLEIVSGHVLSTALVTDQETGKVSVNISAVEEYRKLSESRRKLLGLDAPALLDINKGTRVDFSEMTDEELLVYVDSGREVPSEATS